ncbi:MAG TPA: TetR/AcrR family transcriptional regulator [Ignavibacteria bacterium]
MHTTKSEKNKQKIIFAAKNLFWKYGFRKVSVDEICKEAKLSKMTFYKFFPNKIELAKKIFEDLVEDGLKQYNELMNSNLNIEQKIGKMIVLKNEVTKNISEDFIMDFYKDTKLGLKDFIEKKTNEIQNESLKLFKKGQEEGLFRKEIKPEFYLYMYKKMSEIFFDDELSKIYTSPNEFIMEITMFFVYGVSPR